MRNPQIFVLAAGFWIMTLTPGILMLTGQRQPLFENRTPAQFPEVSLPSTVDAAFYDQVSSWLQDRTYLRNGAVSIKSWLVRNGIAMNTFTAVTLGKDHWLYLTESLDTKCGNDSDSRELLDRIGGLAGLLAAHGKRLYIVIPPNKATIYPEHLKPWSLTRQARSHRANTRFIEGLGEIGRLTVIDLQAPLRKLKKQVGRELYYPTDTHWNCHGASVLADRLRDAVAPGLRPDIRIDDNQRAQLDLDRLIGHRVSRPFTSCRSNRFVTSTRMEKYQGALKATLFRSRSGGEATADGRALVIYDSFMDALLEVIPAYFHQALFVHANDAGNLDALAKEIDRSDLIVIELVERTLCGWSRYVIGNSALTHKVADILQPGSRATMAPPDR